MIKKQLLQKVLEAYIVNATEVIDQISIREFLNGKLTLRNLTLKAETIQDLYGSFLPANTEVLSIHVDELRLAVPWISLNSTPCAVEVQEVSLQLRLRCPAASQTSEDVEEVRFWHEQAERLASAVAHFDEHCQKGAQKPALLQRVLGALRVDVRCLRLELWRPQGRSPIVLGTIEGVRFQPTTQDWQQPRNINETIMELPEMFETRNFVLIEIERVALETACGGASARLGPLAIKTIGKSPALHPRCAPAACTVHRTIELGPLTISGSEDALTTLLGALNDIYTSFGMTDQTGHLVQRYLPALDEHHRKEASKPTRSREALLKMHRKTVMAVENLVYDTRRASISSTASSTEGAEALAAVLAQRMGRRPSVESTGTGDEESDSDSADSTESECFHDAVSECSDGPQDVVKEASSRRMGERPEEAPAAAVVRKTVALASTELRVVLDEGELVVRLSRLSFLADGVRPLSAAAQKCCADLFEVPTGGEAPPLGTILMELRLRGAEVRFHSTGRANGRSPRVQRTPQKLDATLVARLAEQDPPPLVLSKRGSGGPVPCGEVQAEPMQVLVTGLALQVGRGLDELRAWWGRLSPRLPQLAAPPPPDLPSSCMLVQLLQTTVQQEPTDPAHLTVSGSWPMQVTLPMVEVRSTSSVAELPAAVGAAFSASQEFEARRWWQPLFVPPSVPPPEPTTLAALAKEGSIEAQLLASQRMVQWLERQNEELRAKATRSDQHSVSATLRRLSVRSRDAPGACCCAAPLSAWLSKRRG